MTQRSAPCDLSNSTQRVGPLRKRRISVMANMHSRTLTGVPHGVRIALYVRVSVSSAYNPAERASALACAAGWYSGIAHGQLVLSFDMEQGNFRVFDYVVVIVGEASP